MNSKATANYLSKSRIVLLGIMVILILIIISIFATPSAQGQTQNLLLNGDFEEGYSQNENFESAWVAVGWVPFAITDNLDIPQYPTGNEPVYIASDSSAGTINRSLTGSRSQSWSTNYSSAFAGVYQRVPVPADSTVRLSAWTYAWSSTADDPNVSQNAAWMRQRIGIDPTGGTDPKSDEIIWSPAAQYIDTWGELSVETQSASDHVTVFLSAYPNFVLPHNEVFYDTAKLTLISFDLPTPPPDYGIAGDSIPGQAPTPDPLLIGLITGGGTSAGEQGIILFEQANTNGAIQFAEQSELAIPWTIVYTSLLLLVMGIAIIFYLLNLQLKKLKDQEQSKQQPAAAQTSFVTDDSNRHLD